MRIFCRATANKQSKSERKNYVKKKKKTKLRKQIIVCWRATKMLLPNQKRNSKKKKNLFTTFRSKKKFDDNGKWHSTYISIRILMRDFILYYVLRKFCWFDKSEQRMVLRVLWSTMQPTLNDRIELLTFFRLTSGLPRVRIRESLVKPMKLIRKIREEFYVNYSMKSIRLCNPGRVYTRERKKKHVFFRSILFVLCT